VLGFHHGLDLGLLAVVFDHGDLVAGLCLERLVEAGLLRVAIGAAEVDDGDFCSVRTECNGECAGKHAQTHLRGVFHLGSSFGVWLLLWS